jgi:hypothetical protein
MSNGGKMRIGVEGARELELEVDDYDVAIAELEKGLAGDALVWITDTKGGRHGVVTDRLAFVEVDSGESKGSVGFS